MVQTQNRSAYSLFLTKCSFQYDSLCVTGRYEGAQINRRNPAACLNILVIPRRVTPKQVKVVTEGPAFSFGCCLLRIVCFLLWTSLCCPLLLRASRRGSDRGGRHRSTSADIRLFCLIWKTLNWPQNMTQDA